MFNTGTARLRVLIRAGRRAPTDSEAESDSESETRTRIHSVAGSRRLRVGRRAARGRLWRLDRQGAFKFAHDATTVTKVSHPRHCQWHIMIHLDSECGRGHCQWDLSGRLASSVPATSKMATSLGAASTVTVTVVDHAPALGRGLAGQAAEAHNPGRASGTLRVPLPLSAALCASGEPTAGGSARARPGPAGRWARSATGRPWSQPQPRPSFERPFF